ncbi:sugar-binding domain-containing protein [Amycolatopsis alkalitolerans]|uniref:sugar-binding domain-containing protein n=1 Tax=Amycolatopsis alkalitolerans TaxID=2547244 RepID=UPI00135781A1|nr:sugar-binding domain-containing protein [Amycolatopsis alkalitolerans]
MPELLAEALGEVSGRLFDAAGRRIASLLDDRVVALTLDEFRALPHVIGSFALGWPMRASA